MNLLQRFGIKYLIFMTVILFAPVHTVQAEALSFLVVDDAGSPLGNAVVFVPGAPVAPQVTAEPAIMDQIDRTFVPHVLVVEQGRAVKFPNSDNIRHHVYSFSKAKPFEIKLYSGVQEAPLVFDTAGIVALGCNIHDSMVGYIVVSDTTLFALSDTTGKARIAVPALPTAIRVWHPRLLQGSQAAIDMALPPPDAQGQRLIKLSILPEAPPKRASGFSNRFKAYER